MNNGLINFFGNCPGCEDCKGNPVKNGKFEFVLWEYPFKYSEERSITSVI